MKTNTLSSSIHTLLYNPHLLSDSLLEACFSTRRKELTYFINELKKLKDSEGYVQHPYLIVGGRGMGKTTLLRMIALTISKDPDLSEDFLPIVFPEEQYNVKDIADFWMNSLEVLVESLESTNQNLFYELSYSINSLSEKKFEEGADISMDASSLLTLFLSRIGKRPVFLVDNLNLIVSRIEKSYRKAKSNIDSNPVSDFFNFFLRADGPILIGGSIESIFLQNENILDLFAKTELNRLEFDEICDVLNTLAKVYNKNEIKLQIASQKSRIQAIYSLSGGNTRTVITLFNMLVKGFSTDICDDLDYILDTLTPLYKGKFEELAEQSQMVLHSLAMLWHPSTAADVAKKSGIETYQVSSQLNVLVKSGIVEKVHLTTTSKTGFQISERLLNIWLLMRSSRKMRNQLHYLTRFLMVYYEAEERVRLSELMITNIQQPIENMGPNFLFAVAESLPPYALTKEHLKLIARKRISEKINICGDKSTPESFYDNQLLKKQKIRGQTEYITKEYLNPYEVERNLTGTFLHSIYTSNLFSQNIGKDKDFSRSIIELLSNNVSEICELSGLSSSGYNILQNVISEGILNPCALTLADIQKAVSYSDCFELVNLLLFFPSRFNNYPDNYNLNGLKPANFSTVDNIITNNNEWNKFVKWIFEQNKSLLIDKKTDVIIKKYSELRLVDIDNPKTWDHFRYFLWLHIFMPEDANALFKKELNINPMLKHPWEIVGDFLKRVHGVMASPFFLESFDFSAAYLKALEFDSVPYNLCVRIGKSIIEHPICTDIQVAEFILEKAIKIDPYAHEAWFLFIRLFEKHPNKDKFKNILDQALNILNYDVSIWMKLGGFLERNGYLDNAIPVYQKITERNPELLLGWIYLGRSLSITGQYAAAINIFNKIDEDVNNLIVIESEKKHLSFFYLEYAKALVRFGDYDKAMSIIENVGALSKNWFEIARQLFLYESYAKSVVACKKIIDNHDIHLWDIESLYSGLALFIDLGMYNYAKQACLCLYSLRTDNIFWINMLRLFLITRDIEQITDSIIKKDIGIPENILILKAITEISRNNLGNARNIIKKIFENIELQSQTINDLSQLQGLSIVSIWSFVSGRGNWMLFLLKELDRQYRYLPFVTAYESIIVSPAIFQNIAPEVQEAATSIYNYLSDFIKRICMPPKWKGNGVDLSLEYHQ